MKNSTIKDSINGPEFSKLVNKLSKKYQFPFSEGHLKDLAISFDPQNKAYVEKDLDYLNKISNGYALGTIDENETLGTTNNVKIKEFFYELLSEQSEEPIFDISNGEYHVDSSKVSDKDIFKPHLEKNNGILDQNVMRSVHQDLWANMDDPSHYKQFRNQVSTLKSTFRKRDTILNKKSDYFKRLLPLLDFLSSDKPLNHLDDFENVLQSFLSINGRVLDQRKIGQKIELIYRLLDFHPYFMEKVNKKNRPSNINRDCKNLFFASQAKYYVTEDKSTFRKADFVTEALCLKVKVTTMNDFLAKFC
ncbi:MAG: hypothetical protein ACJAUJ_001832 [Salibacteraceae bacterium]|jgi:hypothetical protein